jgi:hypothetical protein
MKPRILTFVAGLIAAAVALPAAAQQPPLDYIYSADTLVERADERACQLALSGQIAAEEGFLLSSETYVKKAGGYGVALALRLRRQRDGKVVDVPVGGLRIDAAGMSTEPGFVAWKPPVDDSFGLVSRNDRAVFRGWGPALAAAPFTVTIARADGRGSVSVEMPPLPEDLAKRHRRCLERLAG